MTRNTDRHIDIEELHYPADKFLPERTRYMAKLSLGIHTDEQAVDVVFTFRHFFDEREAAEQWAEKLDLMLAYGSVVVSKGYTL